MIKASIIIPVYNAENTIVRCIESLEANQRNDIEIIIVEDCSADNSWQVCQVLAKKYSNIRCIHNERNRGVSFTRNNGLNHAHGQYIMFVDSDDWVEADYIENFFGVIDRFAPLLTVCGYINHDEKNSGTADVFAWPDMNFLEKRSLQQTIKSLYDGRLLQQLWNKIFVRDLIEKHNIRFDESISIGEDLRFILTYIKHSKVSEIYYINKPLYHYMRDQDGSLMYRVGYESVEEPLKNIKMLYEIMGFSQDKIEYAIEQEREKQIELYAYLIFHNSGMVLKEKKRLILALDAEKGKTLYKKNKILFMKEKLAMLITKLKTEKNSNDRKKS